MQQFYKVTANITGGLGVLSCAASGLVRLTGVYYIAGYEATTIFAAGTGLMVFACMFKLQAILDQLGSS